MPFSTPNPDTVARAESLYDADIPSQIKDNALTELFHRYPENTDAAQVLLKVTALNSLYSTNIYDVVSVAEHIVAQEIDSLLRNSDRRAVPLIGKIKLKAGNERYNYSFATKYCWWHNHNGYPIYDSYVDKALWHYIQHFQFSRYKHRQDLYDYEKFFTVITEFKEHFSLKNLTLKQLDKFLYWAAEIPE